MNNSLRGLFRYHRRGRHFILLHFVQFFLKSLFSTVSVQLACLHRLFSNSTINWKMIGVILGTCLFFGIVSHADPAAAQLFKTVESQVKTIFGNNIDATIITFLFGVLRIVIWVTAVGFIFFAVYQAQRGEQWQPLMQNAFIVIAAVVVVEGMSKVFFGGATG